MFKGAIAGNIKQEILEKVKGGEKVPVLSQQYGVSQETIYGWLRNKAMGAVSLLEYQRLKKENQQLKEIIGIITYELEKSKKKKAG